jgi:hypothetical protein
MTDGRLPLAGRTKRARDGAHAERLAARPYGRPVPELGHPWRVARPWPGLNAPALPVTTGGPLQAGALGLEQRASGRDRNDSESQLQALGLEGSAQRRRAPPIQPRRTIAPARHSRARQRPPGNRASLQGDPPEPGSTGFADPRIPARPDLQARRPRSGRSLAARSGLLGLRSWNLSLAWHR